MAVGTDRTDPTYDEGLAKLREMAGRQVADDFLAGLADACPELGEHIVTCLYGGLHRRTVLDAADREMITLAVLAGVGGCEEQIRLHTGMAMRCGLSPSRIVATLLHVAGYAGAPRALNAVLAAREVFAAHDLLPVAATTRPAPGAP